MTNVYRPGAIAGEINHEGYRVVEIEGIAVYAHDMAWLMTYGEWPKAPLVHINGNRDDNRIVNLREQV